MIRRIGRMIGIVAAVIAVCGCEPPGPRPLSVLAYGERGSVTLRDDGWVVITDGLSSDMLPISMVSEDLVQAFADDIERKQKAGR